MVFKEEYEEMRRVRDLFLKRGIDVYIPYTTIYRDLKCAEIYPGAGSRECYQSC